jgi:hypothetical protein
MHLMQPDQGGRSQPVYVIRKCVVGLTKSAKPAKMYLEVKALTEKKRISITLGNSIARISRKAIMKHWHLLQSKPTRWLIDGLLPADGFSAVIGKPKAGKSSLVRQLIAAVVKSHPFLNRQVNIPSGRGTGRVLYVHLDRKDQPARVAKELKQLGITSDDETSRVALMIAEDLPAVGLGEGPAETLAKRLKWLQQEVINAKPDLIVIDLLQQFVSASNVNDYAETLTGVNRLQDALIAVRYTGALIVSIHGRKANSSDQPFDDTLGSTALRGSFTTLILLKQYRNEHRYTITSDQTERDDRWGEIDEATLARESDGTLVLGPATAELKHEEKTAKKQADLQRLLTFLENRPGINTEEAIRSLAMAKSYFLELIGIAGELVVTTGLGVKGDPKLYSVKMLNSGAGEAHSATQ